MVVGSLISDEGRRRPIFIHAGTLAGALDEYVGVDDTLLTTRSVRGLTVPGVAHRSFRSPAEKHIGRAAQGLQWRFALSTFPASLRQWFMESYRRWSSEMPHKYYHYIHHIRRTLQFIMTTLPT